MASQKEQQISITKEAIDVFVNLKNEKLNGNKITCQSKWQILIATKMIFLQYFCWIEKEEKLVTNAYLLSKESLQLLDVTCLCRRCSETDRIQHYNVNICTISMLAVLS